MSVYVCMHIIYLLLSPPITVSRRKTAIDGIMWLVDTKSHLFYFETITAELHYFLHVLIDKVILINPCIAKEIIIIIFYFYPATN